ncbi:MAG: tellurite-like stress resistance cysteine protease StiP [Corynebacteriales bacterium]|nr:tellurite-like stress resistance cysteine protease StiP [Mycobacteriales bacterium]
MTTPDPLYGPTFGSYAADEVAWLLTDLSDRELEADITQRERAIQAGTAHYAESLPVEFQPDAAYRELFATVLADTADTLATAVAVVTELVLAERGPDVVFASLARAGTPIGILMRRWARHRHGLDLSHYAVSIVRDRGIDPVAGGECLRELCFGGRQREDKTQARFIGHRQKRQIGQDEHDTAGIE